MSRVTDSPHENHYVATRTSSQSVVFVIRHPFEQNVGYTLIRKAHRLTIKDKPFGVLCTWRSAIRASILIYCLKQLISPSRQLEFL